MAKLSANSNPSYYLLSHSWRTCILFVNVSYKNGNSVTLKMEAVCFTKNTTTNFYCTVLKPKRQRSYEPPPRKHNLQCAFFIADLSTRTLIQCHGGCTLSMLYSCDKRKTIYTSWVRSQALQVGYLQTETVPVSEIRNSLLFQVLSEIRNSLLFQVLQQRQSCIHKMTQSHIYHCIISRNVQK
jgi:hypothetical protein